MSITKVGDAANREEWLNTRKRYLTASSICGWRGPAAITGKKIDWYFEDNNRQAILLEKFGGVEKEFPPTAVVSMAHGTHDEENIIRKFEEGIGYRCEPDNSMLTNSRWPHIAATVDAFVHADEDIGAPETNFCQDLSTFPDLRARIAGRGTGILEIKKSISVGWSRGEVPSYYLPQIFTQMAVLEIPWCVIVAECLYTDPKEKWRKYWDLRPTLFKRQSSWDLVLDQCNEEFGAALADLDALEESC